MDDDRQFQQSLKSTLDRQVVDDETRQALQMARETALDVATPRRRAPWLPLTAGACCLVVALGILLIYQRGHDHQLPQTTGDDLAIIISEDELDFYDELEFYLWFDEEAQV